MIEEAVRALTEAADAIDEAWRDPTAVRDLAGQVAAITDCVAAHPEVFAEKAPDDLLRLRLRSVYLLNILGDSTGLAIAAAEPLAADCERLLGTDHPITEKVRRNLAALTN